MDRELFRALIRPETILTRKRSAHEVTDYTPQDEQTLQEILSGALTNEEQFEARCREIARRFGDEASFGSGSGTSRTPYVLLDVNSLPWKKVRFKIGRNPLTVQHNLQHTLFLNESGEAGWNAAFMYGPNERSPLWIVMVQGQGDYATKLLEDDPQNPLNLIALWDYMAQYGAKVNHRAESAYITHFAELAKIRLTREISTSSKLNDEQKEHWLESIDDGLARILSFKRQDDVATWVLPDADPSNFTNLINGRPVTIAQDRDTELISSWLVCFDQGYSSGLLDEWNSHMSGIGLSIKPADAFLGRIEYSIGWQNAAIQASRVDSKIKDLYVRFMDHLHSTGQFKIPWPETEKFKGMQRTYSLPTPHNQSLSKEFMLFGMASYLLIQMAHEGQQEDIASAVDSTFDAIRKNNANFGIGDDLPHRNTS